MKRELLMNIVLGIFSLIVIGIITIRAGSPKPVSSPTTSTITMKYFTNHTNASDCWIRINGDVYDVTNYLNEHPGGAERILPFCGGPDATEAFATKDGRGAHSQQAESLLAQMLVGTLSP